LHRDYRPTCFYFEIISLLQRTALTGWLQLVEQKAFRLLLALLISISFLVVLLVTNPYKRTLDSAVAAGCQLSYVCIFLGGLAVKLYEDLESSSDCSSGFASQFMGLRSSEDIVTFMIFVTFAMLLILGLSFISEAYSHVVKKRAESTWSVCTIDPPYIKWNPTGIYACFLSHYKMEAASDARYMHDILRKMLHAPVFLDSSVLNDLRQLITNGVHVSDTIVLLATKNVLCRPWCLMEMLEGTRKRLPIIMVQMYNGGFSFAEARGFISNLENEMMLLNPSGLHALHEHLGPNLEELKEACIQAIDANADISPVFNAHAGDNAMVALMKDVIEQMAEFTNRKVTWLGSDGSFNGRLRSSRLMPGRLMDCARASVGKRVVATRLSKVGLKTSRRTLFSCELVSCARRTAGALPDDDSTKEEQSEAMMMIDVTNRESAVFICCSRPDAVSHAQVLRAEIALHLHCGCAIGGGPQSAQFIDESDLFVVLLTKHLPTDPNALFEIYTALQNSFTLVSVCLTGSGYDFGHAAIALSDLPTALEKARPGSSEELQARLPRHIDVASVGKMLYANLTAIIAIPWSPHFGKNHTDAVVEDIVKRIQRRARQRVSSPRSFRRKSRAFLRQGLTEAPVPTAGFSKLMLPSSSSSQISSRASDPVRSRRSTKDMSAGACHTSEIMRSVSRPSIPPFNPMESRHST